MQHVDSSVHTRLAISGTEYPYRPLEELLSMAETLQTRNLELWIPHNFTWADLPRVEHELAKRSLRVAVVSTWTQLNLPGELRTRQELITQSIFAAKALGAEGVNTYFGANPERNPEQAILHYTRAIQPCLDVAIRENVVVTLENEFEPTGTDITRRAEYVKALVEAVACPAFKLNFDPCNFYFAGEEPYPYAYRLLKEHIGYIHLKDGMRFHKRLYPPPEESFLWKDHGGSYVCCPMGKGAIHYEALLPEIMADGFEGYFGLEPHVPPAQLAPTFAESIEFVLHHLKPLAQGELQ